MFPPGSYVRQVMTQIIEHKGMTLISLRIYPDQPAQMRSLIGIIALRSMVSFVFVLIALKCHLLEKLSRGTSFPARWHVRHAIIQISLRMHRLTIVFAWRSMDSQPSKLSLDGWQWLYSECMDTHADLSLR